MVAAVPGVYRSVDIERHYSSFRMIEISFPVHFRQRLEKLNPSSVQTFEKRSIEGETKPEWYVRQMLGSANISGSKLMHIMTGNLSHQIEHHLFPDLPSNRYGEIAPKIKDLFERYGLDYCERPLPQQVYSAWHKVVRLSLPNGWLDQTNRRNLPGQLKRLYQMTTGGPKVRRALQARMTQENRRLAEAA